MLVDDDEDDFFLTEDLLKEIPYQQYTVDWASSYEQAVEKIQENKYDTYLIDYRLGANTGIDLINHIVHLGDQTPFIILTGKGDTRIDMEAGRLGAADYLVKGEIDASKLERSIRYAIQRAEASAAIRQSEQKFRSVFEQSKDCIFIISKDGKIIDINDAASALFGYSHGQFKQMSLGRLFSKSSSWNDFIDQIAQKGAVSDMEVEMKKQDGQILYCLLAASTQYDSEGYSTHYQGIIHDITDRKIAEMNSRITEKLDFTGKMARMIAHEVRNPLTNVNLAIVQLKNELEDPEENLEFYFDIIKRNCERINILISQLMNSTLLEHLKLKEYSLNQLLEDTLSLAYDRIQLNEIRVERHYTRGVCNVLMDTEKMKIALLNIIINAIEAMVPGKGLLRLYTEAGDKKGLIRVQDNGKGIPPEDIDKLFEPFYTNKPEGSGLGLTTTQNIIISHGGKIHVESTPQKGTAFRIEFALAEND